MTELISEKEGSEKRVCPNTLFQSIFMVDKPSAFTELKESLAYLNGANAGILYETHSCLFMSHRNPKRGECLEEEMRVSCRIFFFPFAARGTAHCNKCEMTSEVRRLQPRK